MLTLGEVHTGLLLTSSAVPNDTAAALLAVVPGGAVRTRQRPVRYACSPDVLTGVDCLARGRGGKAARLVGTSTSRVSLTDGHIVQVGTHASLVREPTGRRRPWAHYLAQPGILEVIGTFTPAALADGFLGEGAAGADATLDLGAVSTRTLAAVQRSRLLDHQPPFRSRRTQLRWAAITPDAPEAERELVFRLAADGLRTVRLTTHDVEPRMLADFCADIALHDWLLSTLLELVDRAMAVPRPPTEVIARLRPAIDHLVHTWMPAAHAERGLAAIWQEFDTRWGFSLQWQKTVERIRDQLSVGIMEALQLRRTENA